MAYRNLFIQTGQTPPRGHIVESDLIRPSAHNARFNGATPLVYGNPYRRVYRDESGFYVILHGQKARAYMVEN